jgi:Mg2+ and Co2+ transporter CorA
MEQTRALSTIVIADSIGVHPVTTTTELRDLVANIDFCWLDVSVGDEAVRSDVLAQLGLDASDLSWALRFGQSPRMVIDRRGLRAVTWLAQPAPGELAEVHVLCSPRGVVTVWSGDPTALDEARAHFAYRAVELNKGRFQAATIVLQLLLGTIDQAISRLDTRIHQVREDLGGGTAPVKFTMVAQQLRTLQSRWANFDRYSSAVRYALVGVEAVPGMDARGAAELNDYAEQVEDTEHRLNDRSQWGSNMLQDHVASIAQRQGDQINRLTLVSLIFLPLTFITGFFGMNFGWMNEVIGSAPAFVALGVALPAVSVVVTVAWLRRRGLI